MLSGATTRNTGAITVARATVPTVATVAIAVPAAAATLRSRSDRPRPGRRSSRSPCHRCSRRPGACARVAPHRSPRGPCAPSGRQVLVAWSTHRARRARGGGAGDGLDEPGVESGEDVDGRPDDLGVDGHDGGTDDPIAGPLAGQRSSRSIASARRTATSGMPTSAAASTSARSLTPPTTGCMSGPARRAHSPGGAPVRRCRGRAFALSPPASLGGVPLCVSVYPAAGLHTDTEE